MEVILLIILCEYIVFCFNIYDLLGYVILFALILDNDSETT